MGARQGAFLQGPRLSSQAHWGVAGGGRSKQGGLTPKGLTLGQVSLLFPLSQEFTDRTEKNSCNLDLCTFGNLVFLKFFKYTNSFKTEVASPSSSFPASLPTPIYTRSREVPHSCLQSQVWNGPPDGGVTQDCPATELVPTAKGALLPRRSLHNTKESPGAGVSKNADS